MEVSNVSVAQVALRGAQASDDDRRTKLQLMLLRRALDEQKRGAAELTRMIEGKGNVVDIVV